MTFIYISHFYFLNLLVMKHAFVNNDDKHFVNLVNVVKEFEGFIAVKHLNLSIQKSEIFALLGSSGCGKSTLLRMLAGLDQMTYGAIYVDGQDISLLPPYKRPVNMMFQSYALFPHMTVEANISFGLKQEGISRKERKLRVYEVLDLVQMRDYARRMPHHLSGGQQQRVALARSLVKRPKLLLLDEPMSALDRKIRQRTQLELVEILKKVGVTCIIVTHDQDEAMIMANRIAVMHNGEIVQIGNPDEVYRHPNSRFVAQFIGASNIFNGILLEKHVDRIFMKSDDLDSPITILHRGKGEVGMEIAISIRPENIIMTRFPSDFNGETNWASGIVNNIAYMGSYSMYYVYVNEKKTIMVNVASQNNYDLPALGEKALVRWDVSAGIALFA